MEKETQCLEFLLLLCLFHHCKSLKFPIFFYLNNEQPWEFNSLVQWKHFVNYFKRWFSFLFLSSCLSKGACFWGFKIIKCFLYFFNHIFAILKNIGNCRFKSIRCIGEQVVLAGSVARHHWNVGNRQNANIYKSLNMCTMVQKDLCMITLALKPDTFCQDGENRGAAELRDNTLQQRRQRRNSLATALSPPLGMF